MNVNYFKYLFRSRRIPLIFIAVVYAGICTSLAGTGSAEYGFSNAMALNTGIAMALTFIVPPILFGFIHSRKNSDKQLALPISRKELLITSLVAGVLYISLCWLVTGILVRMAVPFNEIVIFDLKTILGLLYGILMITEMMIINSLLFLLANNMFDGVVVMVGYTLLPLLINGVIGMFGLCMVAGGPSISDLLELGNYISPLMMNFTNLSSFFDPNNFSMTPFYFILPVVYAVVSGIALKKEFIERPSERAEQLSDEPFAYPLLIRLYALCSLQMLTFSSFAYADWSIVGYLAILLAYVIATFVYRRAIVFHPSIILQYAVGVVLTVGIAAAAWYSHGFGMAENYTLGDNGYIVYNYYVYADADDLGSGDINDGDSVDVSFNLNIPVDRIADCKQVVEIVEDYRKHAIADFYDRSEDYDVIGTLSVYNEFPLHDKRRETENGFYNYTTRPMSVKDLCEISKYTKVTVSVYEDNDYKEYSLDEYIAERSE